jgi:hypothetical protein
MLPPRTRPCRRSWFSIRSCWSGACRSRCAMVNATRIGTGCCLRVEWRSCKPIDKKCGCCIAGISPRATGGCAFPTPWDASTQCPSGMGLTMGGTRPSPSQSQSDSERCALSCLGFGKHHTSHRPQFPLLKCRPSTEARARYLNHS